MTTILAKIDKKLTLYTAVGAQAPPPHGDSQGNYHTFYNQGNVTNPGGLC
jgi:hypothetical protein